jgi:hypothetical protein
MTKLTRIGSGLAATTLCYVLATQTAAGDTQAMIEDALSAAPPQIAENATVMTGSGEVLREGDGDYTCFPSNGPTGAMCLDAEWLRWADAWMNKKDFEPKTMGLAYMLAGDPPEGGASNIDPFATEATSDNEWVVEGPHLMVIAPPGSGLDDLTTDPHAGGPYVMWKGTPYAHIMVPVAARP